MTEHVIIEDSLWAGLFVLVKLNFTDIRQSSLLELTENFSVLRKAIKGLGLWLLWELKLHLVERQH